MTILVVIIILAPVPATVQAQTTVAATPEWTSPQTPWGDPDLQGIWDFRTLTPLERPKEFTGKEFHTDKEVADLERRRQERPDGRTPASGPIRPSVHAPWWLDYGTQVVESKRTSLIVDPPDGKIPPLTPEGQEREKNKRAYRHAHPADSWDDRNLFERCITRGLPRLPAGYNNNYQILQTPAYVVTYNEMIHNARIIPLDGRAHLTENIRQWNGDSRARWEGHTLVVDTTNFSEKSDFKGSGKNLHLVERFKRVDAETIAYRFTVEDATTWKRPWTALIPLKRSQYPIFEYACHEGNYGLANILRVARTAEKTAQDTTK